MVSTMPDKLSAIAKSQLNPSPTVVKRALVVRASRSVCRMMGPHVAGLNCMAEEIHTLR